MIGAGVAGQNAAAIALGMQAEVLLLDRNVARLRQMDAIYQGHCQTVASNAFEVEAAIADADMVIGAVLVPGAKAPKLITNEQVSRMKPGSVLVDISIDQGGCFEDSRPTTHADPTYPVHNSVFYCVANMPGAVPHTSTYALTNVTLPYAVELANRGWRKALQADHALALGPEHLRRARHLRPGRRGPRHARHDPGRGPVLTDGGHRAGRAGRSAPLALDRAATGWLEHLQIERGVAANTLTSYRRDLRRYLAFLHGRGSTEPGAVREADVTDFLAELREGDAEHPPLSVSSAARTLVAVRGLHRFWLLEGVTATDPAAAVRPPTPAKRLPKAITVADRSRRCSARPALGDTPAALRDRALLEVLYGCGARISEAVGLDVDDLDLEARRGPAARQGRQAARRAAGVVRPRRRVGAYLVRARPGLAARGAGHAGGLPQHPGRAAVPAERLDRAAGARPSGPGWPRDGLPAHAAALVRHPPARRRRRRAGRAGAARARLGDDDPDLHAGHRRDSCARCTPRRIPRALGSRDVDGASR